jgi:hypothetical protein
MPNEMPNESSNVTPNRTPAADGADTAAAIHDDISAAHDALAPLPADGTHVAAMTYASDEHEEPSRIVIGSLSTRYIDALEYTQCWVEGEQVDPSSIRVLSEEEATGQDAAQGTQVGTDGTNGTDVIEKPM